MQAREREVDERGAARDPRSYNPFLTEDFAEDSLRDQTCFGRSGGFLASTFSHAEGCPVDTEEKRSSQRVQK
jgi:hypothetical protein